MTFRTYFSRRRADAVTVGSSLLPHCLKVCGEMHTVLSSRLHCLLQPVVVSPLWGGSFTYLTLIFQRFSSSLCAYFFHLYRLWNLPRETSRHTGTTKNVTQHENGGYLMQITSAFVMKSASKRWALNQNWVRERATG